MRPINLFIVDDSAFMTNALRKILADVPNIKICGSANNGFDAISFIKSNVTDVILMDIEMPKLDGVETTRIIMTENPKPIILLTAAARNNSRVISALINGAIDFIQKPGGVSLSVDIGEIKDILVEKIHQAVISNVTRKSTGRALTADVKTELNKYYDLIVVGVSTGGPGTLIKILQVLPASFEPPIIIVQHIMEGYTSDLADTLNKNSAIQVMEVNGFTEIEKSKIYLAKAGYHLEFTSDGKLLKLTKNPLVKGFRPSVDVMFSSAADKFKGRILGVILTGMGDDGVEGCRKLFEKKHSVITQDEETSVVYGMPRAVYEAGYSSAVCPLNNIASIISKLKCGSATQL